MNEQRAGAMDEMAPAVTDAAVARLWAGADAPEPVYACADCKDEGFLPVLDELGRSRGVRWCACRLRKQAEARLRRAGAPAKYEDARFANFATAGVDASVAGALHRCRGLVQEFPVAREPLGLMLWGTCGTGKTRLAVSTLLETMERYGVRGRFWDVRRLLLQIRNTFNKGGSVAGASETEAELVNEFARVPVLVIDDLGCERMTDWEATTMAMLLNERYNDSGREAKLTLMTTNYPNLGAGEGGMLRGAREETLGDRVGARTFSRLQEMFAGMEMRGPDRRRSGSSRRLG